MTWSGLPEMGAGEVLLLLASVWALLVAAGAALTLIAIPFIGAYLDRKREQEARRRYGMPAGHPEWITRELSQEEELYLAELDEQLASDL
jgi:hypothetical protein